MTPSGADNPGSSTRPYLLRALHDWCTDNGFTPYIAVHVDASVQVPTEYVKNSEIVLNIGFEATSGLKLGNDFIEFKARFGGVAREIVVPIDHVVAIYARENGQGMAFPMPTGPSTEPRAEGADGKAPERAPLAAVPSGAAPAAPAAPGPRGLRLASSDTEVPAAGGSADPRPARGEPAPAATEGNEPPEPPDQPGPGSGRPALKRIK